MSKKNSPWDFKSKSPVGLARKTSIQKLRSLIQPMVDSKKFQELQDSYHSFEIDIDTYNNTIGRKFVMKEQEGKKGPLDGAKAYVLKRSESTDSDTKQSKQKDKKSAKKRQSDGNIRLSAANSTVMPSPAIPKPYPIAASHSDPQLYLEEDDYEMQESTSSLSLSELQKSYIWGASDHSQPSSLEVRKSVKSIGASTEHTESSTDASNASSMALDEIGYLPAFGTRSSLLADSTPSILLESARREDLAVQPEK